MISVSCPGKFHAFALAEQLQKHHLLFRFFTSYAYQKNTLLRKIAGRNDKECIDPDKIQTFLLWAIKTRMRFKNEYEVNDQFDRWVARKLMKNTRQYRAFVGWASISLDSIRQAKKDGKVTILERGSSHIQYQNRILKEEYQKFKLDFEIDPRVVKKELREYEEVDFISIPSQFVKGSFIEYGIPEEKLVVNNYGSSSFFKPLEQQTDATNVFRIVYVGRMTVRKGMIYLFEALTKLNVEYEAWFIGSMDETTRSLFATFAKKNWKHLGQIDHYELPKYIGECDVAVQPSIEEGLSMVIPQIMSCGIPIIATTNTGGKDIVEEGKSGFIVPIRSSTEIVNKLMLLAQNPSLRAEMKRYCRSKSSVALTWDSYGARYVEMVKKIL